MVPKPGLTGNTDWGDDVQLRPIDPRKLCGIDGLKALVAEIEGEHYAREVKAGQIPNRVVLERVVRVIQNKNAEICHIAEHTRDRKPRLAGLGERSRGTSAIEAAKVQSSVGLQLEDLFCAHMRLCGRRLRDVARESRRLLPALILAGGTVAGWSPAQRSCSI